MKALTRNLVVVFLSTLSLTAVVSAQEIAVIETKFGKIEVQFFKDRGARSCKKLQRFSQERVFMMGLFSIE